MQLINQIIANPVEHSLSPKMHNFVYQKYNLQNDFYFSKTQVEPENLPQFWQKFCQDKTQNGLAVSIPLKQKVLNLVDELSLEAKKIGAVNTVFKKDNRTVGQNTDWLGVLLPLLEKFGYQTKNLNQVEILELIKKPFLKNQIVSVIGNGGAARSMAFAVLTAGANLQIFGRNMTKSEAFCKDFQAIFPNQKITFYPLSNSQILLKSQIILQSTPVGMDGFKKDSLISKGSIPPKAILFEAIYKPELTQFLLDGKEKDCELIFGKQMLAWQAVFQCFYYTKRWFRVGDFLEGLEW